MRVGRRASTPDASMCSQHRLNYNSSLPSPSFNSPVLSSMLFPYFHERLHDTHPPLLILISMFFTHSHTQTLVCLFLMCDSVSPDLSSNPAQLTELVHLLFFCLHRIVLISGRRSFYSVFSVLPYRDCSQTGYVFLQHVNPCTSPRLAAPLPHQSLLNSPSVNDTPAQFYSPRSRLVMARILFPLIIIVYEI